MTHQQISTIRITKTGEDRYRVVVNDEVTQVDEPDLDGSKLEGMLRRKALIGVTPEEVLSLLDKREVGFQMNVDYDRIL